MPEREVRLNVTAQDRATAVLEKISASIEQLTKSAESSAKSSAALSKAFGGFSQTSETSRANAEQMGVAYQSLMSNMSGGIQVIESGIQNMGSLANTVTNSFNTMRDPLITTLNQATAGIGVLQSKVSQLAGGFGLLVAAVPVISGIYAATNFLSKSLADASQETSNLLQLEATWTATMRGSNEEMNKMVEAMKDLSRTSTYASQDVVGAGKYLMGFSQIATDQVLPALQVAIDFAAFSGRSVGEATTAIVYAATGQIGMLRLLGFELSETAERTKDFSLILSELQQRVSGQEAKRMLSYTGALGALQKAVNRTEKAVGHVLEAALVPVIQDLRDYFTELSKEVEVAFSAGDTDAFVKKLRDAFQSITEGMKDMIDGIFSFVQTADFQSIVDGFFGVARAVQQVAVYVAKLIKMFVDLPGWVQKTIGFMLAFKFAGGVIGGLVTEFESLTKTASDFAGLNWKGAAVGVASLGGTITQLGRALKALLFAHPLLTLIVTAIAAWGSVIYTVYKEWDFFVEAFNEGLDSIANNPVFQALGFIKGKAVEAGAGIGRVIVGDQKPIEDLNKNYDLTIDKIKEYKQLQKENIKTEVLYGYSLAQTDKEYQQRLARMNEIASVFQNVDVLTSANKASKEADKAIAAGEGWLKGWAQAFADFGYHSVEQIEATFGGKLPETVKKAFNEIMDSWSKLPELVKTVSVDRALRDLSKSFLVFQTDAERSLEAIGEKWKDFQDSINEYTSADAKNAAATQYMRGIMQEHEKILEEARINVSEAWDKMRGAAQDSTKQIAEYLKDMQGVLKDQADATGQYIQQLQQVYQGFKQQLANIRQSMQGLAEQTTDQLNAINQTYGSIKDQLVLRELGSEREKQAYLWERTVQEMAKAKELAATGNKKDLLEAQQIYKDMMQRASQIKDTRSALLLLDKAREGAAGTTLKLEEQQTNEFKEQEAALVRNINTIKQRIEELQAEQLKLKIELDEDSLRDAVSRISEAAKQMRQFLGTSSMEAAISAGAQQAAGATRAVEGAKAGITAEEAAQIGKVMTDSFSSAMERWVNSAPPVKVDVRVHRDGTVSASQSGNYDMLG